MPLHSPTSPSPSSSPGAQRVSPPATGALIAVNLRRCMSGFCLLYGAAAIPSVMGENVLPGPWKALLLVLFGGSFAAIAVLGALGRHFTVVAQLVTLMFVVALVAWPWAAVDPETVQPTHPWLWDIYSLAMAASIFAFSSWVSAVYITVVPLLYVVVRMTPSGGGASLGLAVLDGTYAFLLGVAVFTLVTLLWKAAATVDRAQTAAIGRYGSAVREHATEVERVAVDAIIHDGVLTTLLSAAKADGVDAELLAAEMAALSMQRLADSTAVQPLDDRPVTLASLRARLALEIERLDPGTDLTPEGDIPAMLLPADVAETLFSAATQALVNSCQHAGADASRLVRIRHVDGTAEIVVADDGAGFDTKAPTVRLGVRVSILERVRNAGGHAVIRSAPGSGTVVTLRWSSRASVLQSARA